VAPPNGEGGGGVVTVPLCAGSQQADDLPAALRAAVRLQRGDAIAEARLFLPWTFGGLHAWVLRGEHLGVDRRLCVWWAGKLQHSNRSKGHESCAASPSSHTCLWFVWRLGRGESGCAVTPGMLATRTDRSSPSFISACVNLRRADST